MTKPVLAYDDPRLVNLLLDGSVGVLPTDTLYGLVARAADPRAVDKLYALKKREHKPGTVVAANTEQLVEIGLKKRYLKAVEQYWPGAISVVIPVGQELGYLHLRVGSLAVRVPDFKQLHDLLDKTGPLLTTSANPPSRPPANTIQEAQNYFGNKIDFYVKGGDLSGRPPSTIIRIVDDAIEILRSGAVKIDEMGRIS